MKELVEVIAKSLVENPDKVVVTQREDDKAIIVSLRWLRLIWARLSVREAFIMQMSKNIGAMATVLEGKVDQIIVTGGIAYDKAVVDGLKKRCEWIAPFTVYPGEDELLALAQGGLAVINGEEEAMKY